MKNAVLVVNGRLDDDFKFYRDIFESSDMTVCSDGGANLIYPYEIFADYIIGDLDSIDPKVLSFYREKGSQILKYPVRKNKTDSELSLDIIRQKGIKNVTMIGYMGDRMDHMLTNINLLKYADDIGLNLNIKDKNNTISYIKKGESQKNIKPGKTVSFISIGGDVKGISLEGFEYDLDDFDLQSGQSILTSNVAKKDTQKIKIKDGNLIMIEINNI